MNNVIKTYVLAKHVGVQFLSFPIVRYYLGTKNMSPGFNEDKKVNSNGPQGIGIAMGHLYEKKWSFPHLQVHGNVEVDL